MACQERKSQTSKGAAPARPPNRSMAALTARAASGDHETREEQAVRRWSLPLMTPEEAAFVCVTHGWMSHAFVHEAAHAVMAVDRGIPFIRIVVNAPENFDDSHSGGQIAGGLHVAPPPSTWVSPDPYAAFEMIIAGKVAEVGAFGHHLEGSWLGDLQIWLTGAELPENSKEEIERALGKTIAQVKHDVGVHLQEQFPRVKRVIDHLSGVAVTSAPVLLGYEAGPWSMEYDEVVEVAGPRI